MDFTASSMETAIWSTGFQIYNRTKDRRVANVTEQSTQLSKRTKIHSLSDALQPF